MSTRLFTPIARGRRLYRVVFDMNVFISAIHFGGIPQQLLLYALEKKFLLYISENIFGELSEILAKKFQYPYQMIDEIRDALSLFCMMTTPTHTISVINKQPGDNRILECAIAAHADFLVTGDKKHLLPLRKFRTVHIVAPVTFLEIFNGKQS